jgi:hypothetical protein
MVDLLGNRTSMEAVKDAQVKPRLYIFSLLAAWRRERRNCRGDKRGIDSARRGLAMAVRRHCAPSGDDGDQGDAARAYGWPEQTVQIVKEEKSPGISGVTYRTLNGGVKQMSVNIRGWRLVTKHVIVTFEINKCEILEPAETAATKPREEQPRAAVLLPDPPHQARTRALSRWRRS